MSLHENFLYLEFFWSVEDLSAKEFIYGHKQFSSSSKNTTFKIYFTSNLCPKKIVKEQMKNG